VRDHASLEQLVVLSNLESINTVMINQGLSQGESKAAKTDCHHADEITP
jgi:hypothetical protein